MAGAGQVRDRVSAIARALAAPGQQLPRLREASSAAVDAIDVAMAGGGAGEVGEAGGGAGGRGAGGGGAAGVGRADWQVETGLMEPD